jgi:hypothetical protein
MRTVLVIGHDRSFPAVVESMLQQSGREVTSGKVTLCEPGAIAVGYIDIVIVDVLMQPPQLMRATMVIRRSGRAIPVVAAAGRRSHRGMTNGRLAVAVLSILT